MMCVGFEGLTVPDSLGRLLDAGVGGVILFARNVESPEQVRALTDEIRRRAPGPVLIGVDQEGGRVRRLRTGYSQVPSMRDLGKANDPDLVREIGRVLGRELRASGFDVDFAPVIDVDTNPKNPVIADRSFSSDAQVVATMGVALIEGLQMEHVAACAKHFPGHGDTSTDSHLTLPRLDHDIERLRRVELLPFVAAVRAGVMSIMTSHVIFAPIDSERPATLSPVVLDRLLRGEIGYDGLVFSDDMEMKAIADHFGFIESIEAAARAGVDVLTVCHNLDKQWQAIETLAKLPTDVLTRANVRREVVADRLKDQPRPGLDVLACAAHLEVVARVQASIELADPTERSKWA